MIRPEYLNRGDSVAIIATARKVSREEMAPAMTLLIEAGLNVIEGKNLYESENQFAGSDKQRLDDLQWALDNKDIKAIIIARGGYGTVRLVNDVDFTTFKKFPKWLVGYSDVTVLHHAIHNIGINTLHATMPLNFNKNKEATQSLFNALYGKHSSVTCDSSFFYREGKAKGQLIGGNLSLLYSLSGTPFDIDTRGKILFIEDLDEYLYHVDRMMMQLKLSGKLKHLAGLIVGGMTDMKDNTIMFGKSSEEIILDAVEEYNYPVCFDFPAGHIDKNIALYLGDEVELNVNEKTTTLKFY